MWSFIPNRKDVLYFRRNHINSILKRDTVVLNTYSDYTSLGLSTNLYEQEFFDMGLINRIIPNRPVFDFGLEIRSVWLRLITNPNEELCTFINKHIAVLKTRYLIGVQLRFGGSIANYKERSLMSAKGLSRAENIVKTHVKSLGLQWSDVYIYLSTDSDLAVEKFKNRFSALGEDIVYSIDDYKIGHSSSAKTASNNELWTSYTKRAIVDMMLLKESDYLVYSKRSSFGKFALELQMSYNITVDVNKYLMKAGMKCSVFHKRDKVGLSVFV